MSAPPIALVTGARGGIGRAVCERLLLQGWRVLAVGRDGDTLGTVPATAHAQADTTRPEGAEAALAACQTLFGESPAGLVHAVGSTLIAPLHRSSHEQVDEILRVNLGSALGMLRSWVAARRTAGQAGTAVLMSSVVAGIGVANHEAIAAAKGGVEALVRSAAATYATLGLRINAVAPGLTETPLTASLLAQPALREGAARQYPLGGVQRPEDVAGVVAWLMGPDASRFTGQILPVDGGFCAIRPLVR